MKFIHLISPKRTHTSYFNKLMNLPFSNVTINKEKIFFLFVIKEKRFIYNWNTWIEIKNTEHERHYIALIAIVNNFIHGVPKINKSSTPCAANKYLVKKTEKELKSTLYTVGFHLNRASIPSNFC